MVLQKCYTTMPIYFLHQLIHLCSKWSENLTAMNKSLSPVFLPGESHGQRSLAGYSLWGHEESHTTERLRTHTRTGRDGVGLGFGFRCAWIHGPPSWLSGKESACQCRKCGFSPWVEKICWSRRWQPAPVVLPGKPLDREALRATVDGVARSQIWLSSWVHMYTHVLAWIQGLN